MSSTFTLHVNVAADQVKLLKGAGYQLCISKKVNGDYCVVWQGVTFNAGNTFQWVEQYQVFAADTFDSGALVQATSEAVGISFGQTAILDSTGTMLPATGPVTGGSFTVENDYQPVNIGVNQKINATFLPIYVDKTVTVLGEETLTPITSILVFFSKEYKTGSMYAKATSSACEVVYSGTTTNTISYADSGSGGNGIWVSGSATSGFAAVAPRSFTPGKGFSSLAIAYDAFAVAKLINTFLDGQAGNAGTSGSDSTGLQSTPNQIASASCPITAIMNFQNADAEALMLSAINKNNARGQWPSSLKALLSAHPT
ncbi:hypothetical protein B0H13DRAFT_2322109 [Mycena leptocephala]|nr:hypothetical protein B0H13DRAFT_2322109 [Mycena leptocephala]